MEKLIEMESTEDGCIYAMDRGFIVIEFACRGGMDTLYWEEDYDEARRKIGALVEADEDDEILNLELHEGDDLFDIMCKYEALTWPMLKRKLEEQGLALDYITKKIVKSSCKKPE